jgi:hypothetical protein
VCANPSDRRQDLDRLAHHTPAGVGRSASSFSVGIRSPGRSPESAMSCRIRSATTSYPGRYGPADPAPSAATPMPEEPTSTPG